MSLKVQKNIHDSSSHLLEIEEEKEPVSYVNISNDDEDQYGIDSCQHKRSTIRTPVGSMSQIKPINVFRRKTVTYQDLETKPMLERTSKKRLVKTNSYPVKNELASTNNSLQRQGSAFRWSAQINRICGLNTRLLDAIEYHKNEEVISVLKEGASPNATCRVGHVSACHVAAFADSDALHLLLEDHADTNRRDIFGRTPLHLAAWAGLNRCIALLLDFPIDLQTKIDSGTTLDKEEIAKALVTQLKSVIDVPCRLEKNEVPHSTWLDSIEHKCTRFMQQLPKFAVGWTPLHITSYAAHHSATWLLLAAGANPNSKDEMGQTPLDIAGGKINDVDVESYIKTIETLIEFGGKLNTAEIASDSGSALHVAVELGSVEAIKVLLAAGAPVTHRNARGNTPLHECVVKLNKEPLQVLAMYSRPDQTYTSVDVTDRSGYTVLQKAILASWIPGVCAALDAGADVTLQAHDRCTAIHLAALQGNVDILCVLLNAVGNDITVFKEDRLIEAALWCAIRSGNLECVQKIIDAGALLNITFSTHTSSYSKLYNDNGIDHLSNEKINSENIIIHVIAQFGFLNILKFLLQDENLENLLDFKCIVLNSTPVEYAALHNNLHTFKFLLQKNIERAQARKETFDPSSLVMICARSVFRSENMFKQIIELMPNAVKITIDKGYFPLHEAIMRNKKDLVFDFLYHGADLSQINGSGGKTALSMIYEYFSNPMEIIESIFDDYIRAGHRCFEINCSTWVDYRVLIPKTNSSNDTQLKVLKALTEIKTGRQKDRKKLLAHPLVESFLYLKWKSLSTFFYLIIFLYILFAAFLSVYIVSVFYYKDKKRAFPPYWNPHHWQYSIYVILFILITQELSYLPLTPRISIKLILSVESLVKCSTFVLAVATPSMFTIESPDKEWRRHLSSLTLMMAWMNVMLLLSKTPLSGYYMNLFWKVTTKVFKILLLFSFLIIMFSSCFLIQFHAREPFDGPLAALIKTLVMMTSEFDYGDTFTKNSTTIRSLPKSTSLQMLRFVFVFFLILAAIVFMNLMIAFAVNDLQNLVLKGNVLRLEKQVYFLDRLEVSSRKRSLFKVFGLYKWFKCKNVPQTVDVVLDDKCPYKGPIQEAILKKASQQFEMMEKKKEAIRNESKLDEIRKAVRSCSYCSGCGIDKKSDEM